MLLRNPSASERALRIPTQSRYYKQTACSTALLALLLLSQQAACHIHQQRDTTDPATALSGLPHESLEQGSLAITEINGSIRQHQQQQHHRSLLQKRRPTEDEGDVSDAAPQHSSREKSRSLRTHRAQARADAAGSASAGDCFLDSVLPDLTSICMSSSIVFPSGFLPFPLSYSRLVRRNNAFQPLQCRPYNTWLEQSAQQRMPLMWRMKL